MADTSNLTSFLEDIADAIRTKKVSSSEIPAANFDTEILSIETGTDTEDATATADDIISPKVAYAKGQQLQGNIVESTEPSDSFSVTETFTTSISVQDIDPYNNLYVYISSNNLYIGYISNGALQPYSYSFTPYQLTERMSFIPKQAKFSRINSDTVIKLFICGYNSADETSCIYYIELNKQSMEIILTKSVSKSGFLDGRNPSMMMVVSPFLDMAIAVALGTNNGGKIDMIGATYTSTSQTLTLQYSNRIEIINFAYDPIEYTANYATDIYNGKGIGYFLIGRNSSKNYTYALVFNMNADGTISYAGDVKQIRYYTNNGTYIYNGDLYSLNGSLLKSSVMSYSSDFGLVNVDNNLLISINDTLLMYDTSNDDCILKDFSVNNCSTNLIQNGTDVYAKQATTSNIYHIEPSEVRSVSLLRKSVTYYNTSDADITANDVVGNKVAYGANGKVIGTIDEIQSGMQIGIAGDYIVNDLSDQVGYVQIITTCGEDRLFRTGSKPTQHVDSDDMASAIGLTSNILVQGNTVLGINGSAIVGDYQVKLFETQDEMNADTNPTEGDLAVVYREEIQNMTADTQTQYITFPETVTLPGAITSNSNCMLTAVDSSSGFFDGQIQLSSTQFRFDAYSDTGSVDIQYTSTDGISYTRTTEVTNPVDLGTIVNVYSSDEWNDNFGYFMRIGGNTFEGLYKYDGTQYNIAETQLNATEDDVYKKVFYGNNGVKEGALANSTSGSYNNISNLREIIENINTNGVLLPENSEALFRGYTLDILPIKLKADNLTNTTSMFMNASNLKQVELENVTNELSASSMFYNCTSLQNINITNTSNSNIILSGSSIFYGCNSLITLQNVTVKSGTFSRLFYNCYELEAIPELDVSGNRYAESVFENCRSITSVPLFDTSSVTNASKMFKGCESLVSVPQYDFSSTYELEELFSGCISLTTIPQFNTPKLGNTGGLKNFVLNCPNLTDDSLNNILGMITTMPSSFAPKNLSAMGMSEEQAQKCTTLSNWSACESAGWTTGY